MLPETSIVIAAYNEEERLPGTLRRIKEYLDATGQHAEIVVVDDGSSDRTAAVVGAMAEKMEELRLISYHQNRGKGFALRTGALSSRGSHILLTDADLSTPIEELDSLKPHLGQVHDIAIGSRGLPASDIIEAQPPWRRGMSWLFNRLVRTLVIDDYLDTQCGFKLFKAEAALDLFGRACIDRFAYDVEILALARESGYRVVEVPVKWKNSPASRVRPLLDSMQMMADLIRIRMNAARRKEVEDAVGVESLDPEA